MQQRRRGTPETHRCRDIVNQPKAGRQLEKPMFATRDTDRNKRLPGRRVVCVRARTCACVCILAPLSLSLCLGLSLSLFQSSLPPSCSPCPPNPHKADPSESASSSTFFMKRKTFAARSKRSTRMRRRKRKLRGSTGISTDTISVRGTAKEQNGGGKIRRRVRAESHNPHGHIQIELKTDEHTRTHQRGKCTPVRKQSMTIPHSSMAKNL